MKNWIVISRKVNFSYFEFPKGEAHPSNYSNVYCIKCKQIWRTNANYVDNLPDGDIEDYLYK